MLKLNPVEALLQQLASQNFAPAKTNELKYLRKVVMFHIELYCNSLFTNLYKWETLNLKTPFDPTNDDLLMYRNI